MNRMISLFQSRGDQAFRALVKNRNEALKRFRIDTPEWHAAVCRNMVLEAESKIWFKAADLLRREELNNPQQALAVPPEMFTVTKDEVGDVLYQTDMSKTIPTLIDNINKDARR